MMIAQDPQSTARKLRWHYLAFAGMLACSLTNAHTQSGPTAIPKQAHHAAAPAKAGFQAPGFYRFKLGEIEVTALSDGTVPQHMAQLMVAPDGQVQQLLRDSFQSLPLETSMNAFLLHTGQQLLLVDTGAGSSFGPDVGNHLLRNLKAAGYRAEDIDAVLLTHVHGDHSGGLIDAQGQAVFPKAQVYVAQAELTYWLSDTAKVQAQPHHQPMFDAGRAALAPYMQQQRLRTFQAGKELFPGVSVIDSPGHTPGHSFFKVESAGQTLVIWGDVVHAAEIQFPAPGITIAYDTDPSAAAQMRLAAFEAAARHSHWVAAPHIAFPGIGHVRQRAGQYEWLPAPYSLGQ